MFHRSTLASLCLIGLAALGCSQETTSSSNIKTGGLAALIDVYGDDDTSATVHVELKVGGSSSNTRVTLDGTDELTATVDGKTKKLTTIDTGVFEADFSDFPAGSDVQVTLDRPDDVTASDNGGTLPVPFALEKITAGLSRQDDDLELTWAPAESGDAMHVDLDGDCIFKYSHNMSDTGSLTIDAGELDSTGGDKPETCDLTARVERTSEGVADTAFDPESYFRLHQRRSRKFSSTP